MSQPAHIIAEIVVSLTYSDERQGLPPWEWEQVVLSWGLFDPASREEVRAQEKWTFYCPVIGGWAVQAI